MISYEHLRELQRFAELGRMSASLLHEISNPLTAALLNLEMSDQRSTGVQRARQDIKLLRRYVEAARRQILHQGRPTNFAVQRQLDQLKCVLLPVSKKAGVRLRLGPPIDCRLYGDPVKFQHIVSNLVVNAIQAYGPKSIYPIKPVRMMMSRQNSYLIIEVVDWGEGISADVLPHIFEAFYSTKAESGHGMGLGLAIIKHYVEVDFKGSITVTSSKQNGTRFTVKLPLPRI